MTVGGFVVAGAIIALLGFGVGMAIDQLQGHHHTVGHLLGGLCS